ncbi:ferredoxin [Thermocrinis minervae]|uniref:Ferredoxin n=1 Tax=Thermocrinis minervae TaxID=381751 RepID=A0A1M6RK91_9AQUI|nr:ferredoxin [Thermocrinis minervae]SHK32844.1 ferredoxin [Thermocrinis minervae]
MAIKTKIDFDTCTACELCYDRVPEVYKNRGDGIATVVNPGPDGWMVVPSELEKDVKEVADECPSGSILIEEG